MENMKHRLSLTTFCKALVLLALVAAVVLQQGLRAQESNTGYYTLTNGSLTWLEGEEGSASEVPLYYRQDGTEIHGSTPVNLQTRQGAFYLALDISGTVPKIVNVPSTNFSRFCVWQRTGFTGYYFQEWDNYRYYLIGTRNELRVEKVEVGASTAYYAKFYNWDFGAAITDITYRNGQRHEGYYWIMFDTVGSNNVPADGKWRMSGDTYDRPEGRVLIDGVDITYCDPRLNPVTHLLEPAGHAALYLPVEVEHHDREVLFPSGQGLTGITLDKTVLKYGDQMVATPQITVPAGGVPVVPGYYQYTEETERTGINANYRLRSDPGYGSAGTPTTRTYYFWDSDPHTLQIAPPPTTNQSISVV